MTTLYQKSYRIALDAFNHFNDEDGWAMASHVALSTILAIFPFLIFGTALSSYLGAEAFSETAVHLVFDTWPQTIAEPIAREVENVLTQQRFDLLTISVLAAAFFASNGVEALRVSLNRAYRVADRRPWYRTRAQSLGFVLVAAFVFMAISFLLVLAPLAVQLARQWLPWMEATTSMIDSWRIIVAIVVLIVGLAISHLWLPAGRRKLVEVLPGVTLTIICWLFAATLFASYLQRFANYVTTYAGLASIVIALLFLYIIAAIFILGAELNAAILRYRTLHQEKG
jgi:membrane protein